MLFASYLSRYLLPFPPNFIKVRKIRDEFPALIMTLQEYKRFESVTSQLEFTVIELKLSVIEYL